jgi:hypothetical protein
VGARSGTMLLGKRRAPFCNGYGIAWVDVSGGLQDTAPRISHNDALKWFRKCLYAPGTSSLTFHGIPRLRFARSFTKHDLGLAADDDMLERRQDKSRLQKSRDPYWCRGPGTPA